MQDTQPAEEREPVRTLDARQRRVFGVLLEKAFTTPEYYPLTLKAVTTGCNQKSNRDPVTSWDEDTVEETLDGLRKLGLAEVVYPESGRTERYRHMARHHYSFSEPQLAILTELLLRGRQSLGELRSRASRMVAIDGLDRLREELQGLREQGFVQASGDLGRRGVEVDHRYYEESERRGMSAAPAAQPEAAPAVPETRAAEPDATPAAPSTAASPHASPELESLVRQLESRIGELHAQERDSAQRIETLEAELRELRQQFDDLRTALGA